MKLKIGPKVKHRRMRPGRYRLRLRAVDSAGNRSRQKRVTFRVIR